MDRRDFLRHTAQAALAFGAARTAAFAGSPPAEAANNPSEKDGKMGLKKAIVFSMLPDELTVANKMKLARDAGFDGVEVRPPSDEAEVREMRSAADAAGIRMHSIIFGGWNAPLSSPDPAVAEQGLANLRAAIDSAKAIGADNVLLVPAIVDGKTRYIEAYERSQKYIRQAIPQAEAADVRILVENVWNNFLLSPIEFARYIDELGSPYVRAYFDVGNVIAFGWPEDWIRTLGARIGKVHLKDFKKGPREWVNLRDGDVNWPEVRKALDEVGYSGFLTAELGGGDASYLKDVAARMDTIIAG